MNRRPGLILAVALVIATDAIALFQARRNRSAGPVSTIELTERELRLERVQRDSSAMVLHLNWRTYGWPPRPEGEFAWFNQAKLEEVGYDCRVEPAGPLADEHYRRMPARKAFVVLHYHPGLSAPGDALASRLEAVDVGSDFQVLRGRYPDIQRYVIVPGMVRLERQPQPQPHLRGRITQLTSGQIYVQPPLNRLLAELPGTGRGPESPRFAAVLAWGRNHEPWVVSVRRLDVPKQQ